jgi:FMN phosphatase YigB (HAD superfamily)
VTEEKRERIREFARSIAEQEIELLPGVAETLAEISWRHHLILMTKGNRAEQADKLARSGLAPYFRGGGDSRREGSGSFPRRDPSPQLKRTAPG